MSSHCTADSRTPAEAARIRIRLMRTADIGPAAELAAAAFSKDISDEVGARRWRERVAHPFTTDPGGAFVAELDADVIGVAQAIVRERLWSLSLFAVAPATQSVGAGAALLDSAMAYRGEADCGLIVSSNDPRALRLYASRGFALIPTFEAEGSVDRRRVPRRTGSVREDDSGDLESLAELTRAIRGAPYTPELPYAVGRGGRLLRMADRGFTVLAENGRVWVLVARDEEAATSLLWNALALTDGEASIRWITGEQQWAIDVIVRARLPLVAYGALCVRGTPGALRPFLPSPSVRVDTPRVAER
jgi:ribosomal protein S18 acetylase RimI-like enzyme